MKWSKLSHVGLVRENNEDNCCVCDDIHLLAVADGMGGHKAGEIASRLALEALVEYLRDNRESLEADPEKSLVQGIKAANWAVYDLARKDGENFHGMGTTIVAAIPHGDKIILAHVGDSRAYKVSNNKIKLLTADHSLVNELVKSGGITPEEAERHPQKNVLTRAIGTSPDVEIDINKESVESGDIIILCTDGLSNMVSLEEIKNIADTQEPLQERVKNLTEKALDHGGEDNITVILFQV